MTEVRTDPGSAAEDPAPQPARAPDFVPKPLYLAVAYIAAASFLALTQSLGQGFLTANLTTLGGELGATQSQTAWLMVAFMSPRAWMPLMLIKIRTQFGLRRFAEVSILIYAAVAVLNLFTTDLRSALVAEALSGIAASSLSTLAFLYMLEPFRAERKLVIGLPLALTVISLGAPLGQALAPLILENASTMSILVLKLGMALVCLPFVYLLPLAATPTMKVIKRLDLVSFVLLAASFSGIVACFTTGAIYWWFEANWLGWLLGGSIAALALVLTIELHRKAPLLDVRWLTSPAMLHLSAVLILFRIVLSEQSAGAPGLFRSLGYDASQTMPLFWAISGGTLAGGLVCAAILRPARVPFIHWGALALIAIAASMDSHASITVAPRDMIVSQALIAFASSLFLASAMAAGLLAALMKGPQYLLSFITVFLSTQILGGTIGSGLFRTLVSVRASTHGALIRDQLMITDAAVSGRIGQTARGLSGTVTDAAQAKAQAVTQLGTQIARQATVSAYNDAFTAIAGLALAALAVLTLHLLHIHLKSRAAPSAAATA
ncbi:MFS transporter [Roseicyclus sp. F158]|uniref:MFS transporter n=1 Tax=Tropicimonas omnivorans TaxID=3075590 RepID=A0ABU3DL58_9RHOB|nr:MFS transporter [Roseicyclus sp. F158]MDT0683847.1 MFS transporter [Roseicyclus sp. F158]